MLFGEAAGRSTYLPLLESRTLPIWAEDLRRRYLRGEASMFVLHGNVYDAVLQAQRMLSLTEFLTGTPLGETKETIAVYNVATGIRYAKSPAGLSVKVASTAVARPQLTSVDSVSTLVHRSKTWFGVKTRNSSSPPTTASAAGRAAKAIRKLSP